MKRKRRASKPDSLPIPQWHKDILDYREGLIKAGKAKFIDWETAKQQIKRAIS